MVTQPGIYSNQSYYSISNSDYFISDDYNIFLEGWQSKIVNIGTLKSLSGSSIISSGDMTTIYNTGTIVSKVYGIDIENIRNTINNGGDIFGHRCGIYIASDLAEVDSTGSIRSHHFGIIAKGSHDSLNISNTLRSDHIGIELSGHSNTLAMNGMIGATDIAVNVTGNLSTLENNHGIYAGSAEDSGGIGVSISGANTTFVNNSFVAADALGTAVRIYDHANATIINNGQLSGEYAIRAGGGSQVIENRGALSGLVSLGAGNDELTCHVSGFLTSGAVNMGSGDDIFDGGRGTTAGFKVSGGAGNDIYYAYLRTYVTISEARHQGIDTVFSHKDYTLGANLENLTLLGREDYNAYGNDMDNHIAGNRGDNILTGGAGRDTFVFQADGGSDTIADFAIGHDRIDLSQIVNLPSWATISHHMSQSHGDTIIDLSNTHAHLKITLENVHLPDVDAAMFGF
jgi:Ca2+-binding RTX toxin-like protein